MAKAKTAKSARPVIVRETSAAEQIGKPSLPWKNPSEAGQGGECLWLTSSGRIILGSVFPIGYQVVAWLPITDLPIPRWEEEEA